jgi:BirA family biotin operon repressor/biotin-[acetyl-CoA-carboxylase] ligase
MSLRLGTVRAAHRGKRLIENARLRSKLSSNDPSRLQISNRERMAICRRTFSLFSSFEPQAPSLENLIANLELEFPLTHSIQRSGIVSNRKFFAIFHRTFPSPRPSRLVTRHPSQITHLLIETPRLEFPVTPMKQKAVQNPNRDNLATFQLCFSLQDATHASTAQASPSSFEPQASSLQTSPQSLASSLQNKYASMPPMATTARIATLPGTTDRRIDALLALLAENSTIVISGAKIAQEIGVSRQQVWRWIEQLRALGVRVKGHAATGYHIERVPDILAPQLLSNQLAGTAFARRIYHFFKIDSTNNVAMQLGEAGEPHGAVVLAEEQTAGRGRAGRKWLSEKSAGIHCTVLLRPQIPPAYAPLLTLVAGLAARDACAEELNDRNLDIRWPNDLLFGGRKFSGILTEMHAEPDRVHYAVIGIGINVNQTKMPAELADIATSLRIETGKPHSRLQLLIRLLRHLDRYYNQFIGEGAEPILRRFADVSTYFKGKHVKISTATETFTGITAGLEPSGVLRVARDDGRGTELILSGDVSEAS